MLRKSYSSCFWEQAPKRAERVDPFASFNTVMFVLMLEHLSAV
jgi:hypothetical protein